MFGAGMTLGRYDQAQEVLLETDAWFLPEQFRIGAKSESEQRVIHPQIAVFARSFVSTSFACTSLALQGTLSTNVRLN